MEKLGHKRQEKHLSWGQYMTPKWTNGPSESEWTKLCPAAVPFSKWMYGSFIFTIIDRFSCQAEIICWHRWIGSVIGQLVSTLSDSVCGSLIFTSLFSSRFLIWHFSLLDPGDQAGVTGYTYCIFVLLLMPPFLLLSHCHVHFVSSFLIHMLSSLPFLWLVLMLVFKSIWPCVSVVL